MPLINNIQLNPTVRGTLVSPAVTPLVRSNGNRAYVLFINVSSDNVWILPSEAVTVSGGFFVPPNGGVLSFSYLSDFLLPSSAWFAISSGAASEIIIIDQVISPRRGSSEEENV